MSAPFRFQATKVMLTYKSHLDKNKLIEFIKSIVPRVTKFIRAAHETGKSTGVEYDHTHVLIRWDKIFETRNCRYFDYENIHPNWSPVKTETHWRNQINYIAKEDTENSDLLIKMTIVDKVWNAASREEAILANVHKPSDIIGINMLFDAKPASDIVCTIPNRPWQEDILTFVNENKPDRRSVYWIHDPKGGCGKTVLARYMMANKLAYMVKQCGGSTNFATIMTSALESGWNQNCFILDLPRSAEDHKFYGCLEEVCDGVITTTKYKGSTLVFNQPHIFVFANFLPDRSKMSADRWRIHKITDGDWSLDPPLIAKGSPETYPPLSSDNLTGPSSGPLGGGLNIISPPPPDNMTIVPLTDEEIDALI